VLGTVAWAVVPQSSAGVARDGRELMMGRAAARPFYVQGGACEPTISTPGRHVPCPGTSVPRHRGGAVRAAQVPWRCPGQWPPPRPSLAACCPGSDQGMADEEPWLSCQAAEQNRGEKPG
jgi:hypothetical protein